MLRKEIIIFEFVLISTIIFPLSIGNVHSSPARTIPAIVSTDWLNAHLSDPNLVILDIRSEDLYNAGHIPGAINVPEGMWYINPPFSDTFPWMEMPSEDYLLELIGNASITQDSLVVVVGSTSGPLVPIPLALYSTGGITRVAMTLLYAGIENVAILDGGYEKWVEDGYSVETTPNIPTPTTYTGTLNTEMMVSKEYVASKIGEAIIIDARDLEVYLGFIQEPWCARVGHIPTARSFPTPWLWDLKLNATGTGVIYTTYKSVNVLDDWASCIVGTNKSAEIIVYCGVGGYASTMYFILSEVLNYTNVKMYDGSAQEWTSDFELPVVYEDLGSEYMDLQSNYTALQDDYDELQESYDKLQDDYNELRNDYDELAASTLPAYLVWILTATTVIFLLISIYLAVKLRGKG